MAAAARQRVDFERRAAHVRVLGLAAIAVHGLFLLGLLGIASYLVFGCLLQVRPIGVRGWLAIVTAGWWCAMAAWLVVLWLFPGG